MSNSAPHSYRTSYALLGSGLVARHFQVYLRQLELPFRTWSRNGDPDFNSFRGERALEQTLDGASHVLLALSDPVLNEWAARLHQSGRTIVHFSGTALVAHAHAAHPLMTFGAGPQTREFYERIPFVVDEGTDFHALLPGWPNRAYAISPERRALYHALCVLAGNASFLMWRNVGRVWHERLGLPPEILTPFLQQTAVNAADPEALATGPAARGDGTTLDRHLRALEIYPQLHRAYEEAFREYRRP